MDEINEISSSMESYFQENKALIKESVKRFNLSLYGKDFPITTSLENYTDFSALPLMDNDVFVKHSERLKGEGDIIAFTAGTTGESKKVYHKPFPTIKTYQGIEIPFIPEEFYNAMKGKKGIFLRYRHRVDTFSQVRDNIFNNLYPDSFFGEITDRESAVSASQKGDVLIFYDYPSAIYRFLYFVSQAIDENEISVNQIKKDSVFIELCGEPIEEKDLRQVSNLTEQLFGAKPLFTLTYGMEEAGLIGTVKIREQFGNFNYRISPGVFIEVVDSDTGLPLRDNAKGEVVVTPLGANSPNLIRYRTGDLGILFLDTYPSLELFGKKEELGYIYVCGENFSLPLLAKSLRYAFKMPMQTECKRVVEDTTGVVKLNFNIYMPKSSDETKEQIEKHIVDFIVNTTDLLPELENELAIINVGFKEDQFIEKEWRKLSDYQ